MIWLSKEQIIYLHSEIIKATGGEEGLRDDGILQSAIASPLQTYDSVELFPTVVEKASRLACGLTQFHPFVDGNKRIGAHAMLIILELNGIMLSYSQTDLADMFLHIADGSADYLALCKWIKSHVMK